MRKQAFLFFLFIAFAFNGLAESGQAMTKRYEGWRSKPYVDVGGRFAIGYGFKMSDPAMSGLLPADVRISARELSKKEGDRIFNTRYRIARRDARKFATPAVFDRLSPTRQNVLIDMAYNLGLSRLLSFIKLRKALKEEDFTAAGREMKNSKWHRQTGRRARELARMMRKGA